MKNAGVKNILLLCSAFVATAIMLTLIQPPVGWAALAWIALVPFILACSPDGKPLLPVLASYLISLCYWLGNLYWVRPVTFAGWLAFCLYIALLWPILVLALRFCREKKVPLFLAVPIVFVGAERLQGLFLGGFYWRLLAHSQFLNTTLIQIADIFGAAGLSFLIAMVNGLLAELIVAIGRGNILKVSNFLKTALVCAALIGAVFYGRWRINQADKFVKAGPLIASVQSNVPQSVKESLQADNVILEELLRNSSASAQAGAELIVWPETMVLATLDQKVLKRLTPSYHCNVVDKMLRDHAKNTAFVLVGAYGGLAEIQDDLSINLVERYNSAFLYQPDGTQADKQYNKIHLVPFGEVVPFKKSIPWLYNLLMKFTPYDYDYSLDYGKEYIVFEMTAGQAQQKHTYKFAVMICYEDTVPAIARKFAADQLGQKRIDWLVNISNDGWFVKFTDGKVDPSTELAQHTAVCVFRAVENRLAVLRSVNTGISCLIDTVGCIKNGFVAGNLPYQALARKGVAGWFVDRVPIDSRTTFFSRYGQWLDFSCAVCLILLIITPPLTRLVAKQKKRGLVK